MSELDKRRLYQKMLDLPNHDHLCDLCFLSLGLRRKMRQVILTSPHTSPARCSLSAHPSSSAHLWALVQIFISARLGSGAWSAY